MNGSTLIPDLLPPTQVHVPLAGQSRLKILWEALHYFLSNAHKTLPRVSQAVALANAHAFSARRQRVVSILSIPLLEGKKVSCIAVDGSHYITSSDIIHVLVTRFAAFGRPVRNSAKFEEGIHSDLRNLPVGQRAIMLDCQDDLLLSLSAYGCVRTSRRQKIYEWQHLPLDRLFLNALERDLQREKRGFETVTEIDDEPARSFTFDPHLHLYQQPLPPQIFGGMASPVSGECRPLPNGILNSYPDLVLVQQELGVFAHETDVRAEAGAKPSPLHPTPMRYCINVPFMVLSGVTLDHQCRPAVLTSRIVASAPCLPLSAQQGWLVHSPITGSIEDTFAPCPVSAAGLDQAALPVSVLQSRNVGNSTPTPTDTVVKPKLRRCTFPSCDRSFTRSDHLKRHILSHTGARPFKCTYPGCEKSFTRSDNFLQHERIHPGQQNPRSTKYKSLRGLGQAHTENRV